MTPHRDGVLVAKNLMDLDIEIPEENDEEETEYNAVRTNKYSKTNARRAPRIYCRLLTSTIGSPLRSAESPRQLLQAVLDAILGYWRLVNLGVLHRDISDGNVLMLREGQGYNKRDWKIPSAASSVLDLELDRSEIFLWGTLHRLGREPTGMLNDFDLFTTQGKMGAVFFDSSPSRDAECEVEPEPKRRKTNAGIVSSTSSSSNRAKGTLVESHPSDSVKVEGTIRPIVEFRVGTAAFMSARVQDVQPGYRYEHTFVDDLESFLWLILVCAVEHIDSPGGQPTEGALKLQHKFAGRDHSAIAITKSAFLIHTSMMLHELASCENSWATDPAIVSVVRKLGQYFGGIYLDSASSECTPTEVFPAVVEIFTSALAS
ncbi:hypothetical protein FRC08_011738 [Ceratobasidium sp. 394]|nr:hypothetical protein FRC08_011738 [Ceratobasidium sp. 394]